MRFRPYVPGYVRPLMEARMFLREVPSSAKHQPRRESLRGAKAQRLGKSTLKGRARSAGGWNVVRVAGSCGSSGVGMGAESPAGSAGAGRRGSMNVRRKARRGAVIFQEKLVWSWRIFSSRWRITSSRWRMVAR